MLLMAALPLAAADMTKLTIKLTNQNGHPVSNAEVIIKFIKGRSKVKLTKIRTSWELRSSEEGLATIPEIPQGEILIQVNAKFYQTFGERVVIYEPVRTVEITLKPPQEQYSAH